MQCSAPLRHRFAAHVPHANCTANASQSYLWISDEQLSDAFARFVRVSHTHRRYGSNVPGPLESRRRSAKRQMGLVAAGASASPPLADFGALFGNAVSPEQGMRWQPPYTTRIPPSAPPLLPFWPPMLQQAVKKRPKETPDHVPSEADPNVQMQASKDAFALLLKPNEKLKGLDAAALAPFIKFLQGARDEPDANNLLTLLQWLEERPIRGEAIKILSGLVLDKVRLGTLSLSHLGTVITFLPRICNWQDDVDVRENLLHSFTSFAGLLSSHATFFGSDESRRRLYASLLRAVTPENDDLASCSFSLEILCSLVSQNEAIRPHARVIAPILARILASMPSYGCLTEAHVKDLTSRIMHIIKTIEDPDMATWVTRRFLSYSDRDSGELDTRTKLTFWLRCLWKGRRLAARPSEACGRQGERSSPWPVYDVVAKFYDPRELAHYFTGVENAHFVRALLHVWLPKWDRSVDNEARQNLPRQDTIIEASEPTSVEQLLPTLNNEMNSAPCGTYHGEPLVRLVNSLKRHNLPYQRLIEEVFETLRAGGAALGRTKRLSRLLKTSDDSIEFLRPILVTQVTRLLDGGERLHAMRIYLYSAELSIPDLQTLPSRLLVDARADSKIWEAIFDADNRWVWSASDCLKPQIEPWLSEKHIDLVQRLALAAAKSPEYTPRQAYRRVWHCYRFLRDHGMPLTPLISRAMTRAGIIRYLQAHLPIPNARAQHILLWVRRLEGDEVADALDHRAYGIRQNSQRQILQHKEVRKRLQMGRTWLRDRNWRLKGWTKRRPVRVHHEDGSHDYVVPKDAMIDTTGCKSGDVTSVQTLRLRRSRRCGRE